MSYVIGTIFALDTVFFLAFFYAHTKTLWSKYPLHTIVVGAILVVLTLGNAYNMAGQFGWWGISEVTWLIVLCPVMDAIIFLILFLGGMAKESEGFENGKIGEGATLALFSFIMLIAHLVVMVRLWILWRYG